MVWYIVDECLREHVRSKSVMFCDGINNNLDHIVRRHIVRKIQIRPLPPAPSTSNISNQINKAWTTDLFSGHKYLLQSFNIMPTSNTTTWKFHSWLLTNISQKDVWGIFKWLLHLICVEVRQCSNLINNWGLHGQITFNSTGTFHNTNPNAREERGLKLHFLLFQIFVIELLTLTFGWTRWNL